MNVGFTGTQHGLTDAQRASLVCVLRELLPDMLQHGDCVGADATAHEIAYHLGAQTAAYPAKVSDEKRAFCAADIVHPVAAPLNRNRAIVDATQLLVACPRGVVEEQRSGTWATVRYARKRGRPICFVYPNGIVIWERRYLL